MADDETAIAVIFDAPGGTAHHRQRGDTPGNYESRRKCRMAGDRPMTATADRLALPMPTNVAHHLIALRTSSALQDTTPQTNPTRARCPAVHHAPQRVGRPHPTSRGGGGWWCGTSTGGLTPGGREACDGITHMHPTASGGATLSHRVGGSAGLGNHTRHPCQPGGGVGS